jgi:long-chain acyl-CoA synthetase
VINAGGVKVHPKTIETALLKLPTVLDAAAFGVPDEVGMTRIWTAVVALARIDDAVLKAFCRRALPDVPLRTIVQVKVLPRNENGKVLRAPLVDMALRIQRQAVGQAP